MQGDITSGVSHNEGLFELFLLDTFFVSTINVFARSRVKKWYEIDCGLGILV